MRSRPIAFLKSTTGLNWLAAVSGLLACVFLLEHVLGSLMVFLGPDLIDRYSTLGRRWFAQPIRAGIWASILIHIGARTLVWRRNRQAKSPATRPNDKFGIAIASTLLAFMFWHAWLFRLAGDLVSAWTIQSPYRFIQSTFTEPAAAAVHLAGVVLLCAYLWNARNWIFVASGIGNPRLDRRLDLASKAFIAAIGLGFLSVMIRAWTT